jgi:hypothetical protein
MKLGSGGISCGGGVQSGRLDVADFELELSTVTESRQQIRS